MLVHKDSQTNSGVLDVRPLRTDAACVATLPAAVALAAPKVEPLSPVTVGGRTLWTDPRVAKSFDEAKHPRDPLGQFAAVLQSMVQEAKQGPVHGHTGTGEPLRRRSKIVNGKKVQVELRGWEEKPHYVVHEQGGNIERHYNVPSAAAHIAK